MHNLFCRFPQNRYFAELFHRVVLKTLLIIFKCSSSNNVQVSLSYIGKSCPLNIFSDMSKSCLATFLIKWVAQLQPINLHMSFFISCTTDQIKLQGHPVSRSVEYVF